MNKLLEAKSTLKQLSPTKISTFNVKDLEKKCFEAINDDFNTPINLNGYGYLYFNPNQLAVNHLRLNGTKLQFDAVLEAFPKVSLVPEETKNNK